MAALLLGCTFAAADSLTLTFGSYRSSPVLLTHFSIESPLAPTPEMVIISAAEEKVPRTNGASAAISAPRDVGGDRRWKVAAQWIELQTSRAYRSEVSILISGLTEAYGAYELNVIFGPHGLFLIGSDRIGNQSEDRVDLAMNCGQRVPSADRNWGSNIGRYPELPAVRSYMRPVPPRTDCASPAERRLNAFVGTGASMKRIVFAAMVLLLGCHSAMAADSLSLTFGSYQSSPVVLTHFAIEMPLAETQRLIVVSAAEREMPRAYSANALSLPRDVDHDGHWTVAAQWVELQTDQAWRATVNVPISALTEWHGSAQLNVIFGPNGLFLIGSDKIGNRHSDRVDVAYVCGKRVPGADRSWRTETGYFPDLPDVLDYARPVPARTHCPMPAR